MLCTPSEVIRCLVTYTDWWQPSTASVLQVGAARRSSETGDGLHPGVLDSLDERTELCRRVTQLDDRSQPARHRRRPRNLRCGEVGADESVGHRDEQRLRLAWEARAPQVT